MQELTKLHVDWKKIAVVGMLVLLSGLVTGGATWYVSDMSKQAELDVKDDEIATLETRIEQLEAEINNDEPLSTSTKNTNNITEAQLNNLLATHGVKMDIPKKFKNIINMTSSTREDNNSPWYAKSTFSPLSIHLSETGTDGVSLMVYNTTDPKILKTTGGWESCEQATNEKIGLHDVLVFTIDDGNQYMKVVIRGGKSYVFGYPTALTVQDMNTMISTLEFI
jgi:hypothetical protein